MVGQKIIVAHEFFITLAACNTVIPITKISSLSSSMNELQDEEGIEYIDYQGESPDEQALVSAAAAYGYTLIERTSGHIVIDINGEKLRLDVLGLHEFDSAEKNVVIRFPNNVVKVLVKGAHSSMLSILDMSHTGTTGFAATKIRRATQSHLLGYSSEGLRTLVIAARDLNDAEFEEWQTKYEETSTSLTERSAKLHQAADLIECNLYLLGATDIKDKLQEVVLETIESLRQAGIKVWVLSGGKQETAFQLAYHADS